jgi:hypothetical protein
MVFPIDRTSKLPFTCNFQMFAQLHPVPSDIKMADLLEYERGKDDASLMNNKRLNRVSFCRTSIPSRYLYNTTTSAFAINGNVFSQLSITDI